MPFVVKERLYHTADKQRLVRHGDPEAAFLAFTVGQELTDDELRRSGVAAFYATPEASGSTPKMGRTSANKMAARAADKAGSIKANVITPAVINDNVIKEI
jgi:hypothetical protein